MEKGRDNLMKHDISWHENCYNNHKVFSDKEDLDLVLRRMRWSKDRDKLDFYRKQIDMAIKENKDSFDEGKFLVKRQG
jgi:hypothetical protein